MDGAEQAVALERARAEAAACTNCDLYKLGTQTVFGEGAVGARVMLVGEQPGDKEDRAGRPFVGPAGQLLDRALVQAGIDRGDAYVTNVVKHFKWRPAGKVRLHQKPNAEEIRSCRPWLEIELQTVEPRVVVCLGATAAQALLGRSFRVTQQRGQFVEWPYEPLAMATVHPSSILRIEEPDDREAAFSGLVSDLAVAATALDGS
ncbi:MAG TPA: UdgX family uracil-DNA binding protein [Acidimicrobiales bacterium]|nr:UdgX family uracil-DNA binding protein [Acidimicrobiales bacterium]